MVTALEAVGIRATTDQSKLNPPAVLVGAPTITTNRLAGVTAIVDLTAVVADTGRGDSLDQLAPLVAAVVAVWPATYEFPVDIPSVAGGNPMPGRRLTCPIRAY
jgi:hypothetical protein